jgi:hypothetical protein
MYESLTVPATPAFQKRINEVATSIKDKNKDKGRIEESKQGGITFVHEKTTQIIALGREYFATMVFVYSVYLRTVTNSSQRSTAQEKVAGLVLATPTKRPELLRQTKGCMMISKDDISAFITTSKSEEKMNVNVGDVHYEVDLVPDTITFLMGDSIHDIIVYVPPHIDFYLILHPRVSAKTPMT